MVDAFKVKITFQRVKRPKYVERTVFICADLGSMYTLLYTQGTTTEEGGWSEAMESFLFRLGFAPGIIVSDKASSLFPDFRTSRPGTKPPLCAGALLWAGAGVKPIVHHSTRGTGRVQMEAEKKVAGRCLYGIAVGRIFRTGQDDRTMPLYWFHDDNDFRNILPVWEQRINEKVLSRVKKPRIDVWQEHLESVRWRESRKLVPDAASRAHVIEKAVLIGDESQRTICIPSGLRVSDANTSSMVRFLTIGMNWEPFTFDLSEYDPAKEETP